MRTPDLSRPLPALLIASALGMISALGFAPIGWAPLTLIACAALMPLIATRRTGWQALTLGWCFGLGQFAVGLNWIAGSFRFQDAMPVWLGAIAVGLLSAYLAVYPALAVLIGWSQRARPLGMVAALAGAWGLCEWLRASLLTGFAWNPIGVVAVGTPWLGAAGWIGTYGVGMLVILGAGGAYLAWRRHWGGAVGAVLVVALAALAPRPPLAEAPAQRMVRLVQPNIGQQDKWRDGFEAHSAEVYRQLSLAKPAAPTMLLWPEAAVTVPLVDQRAEHGPASADELLRATRTLRAQDRMMTGGLSVTSQDGINPDGATNSIFMIGPRGQILTQYDKAHLVPFGEYLPVRGLLTAIGLSRLAPGNLDFAPGAGPLTQDAGGWGRVGFAICYEVIFSGRLIDRHDRPQWLFNPSNDAWFGAWGPPQHLAQAQLRAAEEGIPILRATPTGISAIIDADGRMTGEIGPAEARAINGLLPPPRAPGPFALIGNAIPIGLALVLMVGAIALRRRTG